MKTILVTGGAGFIGSHLCERLVRDGHQVISLDNYFTGSRENHVAGAEYREGHTKDIEALIPETPDLVFHLGEYSHPERSFEDIETVWDLNKTGTFAVLEFVRQRGSKIVYAGSSTKFGDGGLGRDQSPYAWTKASNTELVKNYAAWFGIPYAITYFYNVYGPRERTGAYGTLVEIFKQNHRAGRPLTVTAPGTQRRNFTHVSDIVNGLVLVGEQGEGDDYGLGNERSYSILEVAKLFGGEVIMLPERPGNRLGSDVDIARSRALGWEPRVSLEEDIRAFVQATEPALPAENRVLVFTTTFHPITGPAEDALRELMLRMPDLCFDVITTRYAKGTEGVSSPAPNATVYRVGWGTPLDKFLLPVLGAQQARTLSAQHRYLFAWSLMASYATLAAIGSRNRLPLLVTLADQRITWYMRFLLLLVLRHTDQVYASNREQARALSLDKRATARKSLGAGDAFANQIRFVYTALLRQRA